MKASTAPLVGRNPNRLAAAVTAALAAAAFAATFYFDPVPEGLPGLGAVEFPRLICVTIIGLSLLLAVQRPARPDLEAAGRPDHGALAIWACCVLFIPAMELAGMLGAGAIFLVTAGWLWGERRWPLLVAVAAAVTFCLWLVFVRVFGLTLPGGLLSGS